MARRRASARSACRSSPSRSRGDRVGVRRAGRGHRREAVRVMMRLPPFTYLAPVSTADAVKLMADHGRDAMLVAGGTDLYPNMKRRQFEPTVLVGVEIGAAGHQHGVP